MAQPQLPTGFELVRSDDTIAAVKHGWREPLERAGLLLFGPKVLQDMPGVGKLGGRGTVFSLTLPEAGEEVVVRCSRRGGALATVLKDRYWGVRRPFTELAVSEAMSAAGLPAQETLAVVAQRAGGPFYRTAVVTRRISGAIDLAAFVSRAPRAEAKRAALDAVARAIRHMHDAGFLHADLQMKNILVRAAAGGAEVFLIDLDRARHVPQLSARRKELNLFRLNRSVVKLGLNAITNADRVRFLRSYYGAALSREEERRLMVACTAHLRRHQRLWR